ncbi:hypothetical protein [Streptomyces sp. YGL11-2]|uniref:hypothetical protein n=1 Tax=Streptomyces sp. YGL11-2 TaxID=3414028 RepID=UPI003CF72B1B
MLGDVGALLGLDDGLLGGVEAALQPAYGGLLPTGLASVPVGRGALGLDQGPQVRGLRGAWRA